MTEQLDLLLINPGGRQRAYQSLGAELSAVEPPLWIGLLATNARNGGYSVRILDAEADDLIPADVGRQVADINPRLAVLVVFGANPSASTQKMGVAGDICREIRHIAPSTQIMLAGLHVTALPERTMREEAVDFVCQGEGPATIRALLDVLRKGTEHYAAVRGLWHRREGHIVSNPPAPLIRDLDAELPGAAWDLLPMDKYRAHNWHCFDHLEQRSPYAVIYTSLGCPYGCHFCCINALFGKQGIRYRGISNVVEEIDLLVNKYGVKNIKIIDELFVLKPDRTEQFCDLLISRGYDLNFWAYARVDTVNPGLLKKLRLAGVRWLCYGFESASTDVRDGVSKRFSNEQVARAIRWTQEAGIHIIANYMVGLPDDTAATMQQTLAEAQHYNFEFFNLYCAMAYPGSKLYQQAVANGWSLPESWDGYAQLGYETLPLPSKHLTAGEVLKFRDQAFVSYYSNPAYLEMLGRKFGAKVVEHVRQMLDHKIRRKYSG
jgi:radical SAM superfamily enzyme YgiQ (UPF0313 family)